jgi:hypothetical protein
VTDTGWRALVLTIARQDYRNGEDLRMAKEYLWAGYHWERLKDTPHGCFIRECVSPVPDLGLRIIYREQVLNYKEAA